MVGSVTASALAQDIQTTQEQKNTLSQDFDDFLVLLTTQMQNQDPLSPMESTEFTNQLIGFSQVEQQINSNEKLEQLLSLQLSTMSSVAIGYVGMEVNFIGSEAYYNGEDPINLNYIIEDDAVVAKLNVIDGSGNVVNSIDVDPSVGQNQVLWDGLDDNGNPVEPGNYTLRVDALDSQEKAVKTQTAVPGKVVGIEAQNGVIQLLLEGDRVVPIGAIITAREPTVAQTPTQPESQQQGA